MSVYDRKDFAKIIESPDGKQVLITLLYDVDEDKYNVTLSYYSEAMGDCFLQYELFFNDLESAYKAFDIPSAWDDIAERVK